jgi:hypothetical protein
MLTRYCFVRRRTLLQSVVIVAVLAWISLAALAGQGRESKPVDLPNGPAKSGFDISRFSNSGNGRFETFYVRATQPLREVLNAGRIAEDTRVLVTDTAGGRLALLADQMAFHHIAQGNAGGKDWLVSF